VFRKQQFRTTRRAFWAAVCATPVVAIATAHAADGPAAVAADAAAHFEAAWPDGTRKSAPTIDDWTGDGRLAVMAGRKLFSEPHLVRALCNTAIPYRPIEGPFVEFVQGDVFPAQVTGRAPTADSTAETLLLARPGFPVDLPGAEARDTIRIRAGWARRLVWTRAVREELRPGTAFRRDGTSLAFQRLRFQPDGMHLLTESKVVSCGWDELAELHLPASDWWDLHAREVAALSPDLQAPLVRINAAGMRLTTSLDRFQLWSRSERPALKDTLHIVQPAWSADVLCVRRADVRRYSVSTALEVPLSAIEPAHSEHHPVFSRLLGHWARDASVAGGPLVSGGREFAWGIGTCGGHELEYPLPSAAARFTTGVGLDRAAGPDGCIRGRIEWSNGGTNAERKVLHETATLLGNAASLPAVSVDLPSSSGQPRLRLVSDPVNAGAPGGAACFDIHDFCDWLEPRVELAREAWTAKVAVAIPNSYPALAGWMIDSKLGRDWRPTTRWDPTTRPYPSFHREWVLPGFPLSFKRTIMVPKSGSARWNVQVYRAHRAAACRLDAFVNQRPIARLPLPEIPSETRQQPLAIDLSGFAGREMQIELRLVPLAGETSIVWEGAEFERPPDAPPP
jgi:hypothetical protein